jgi:hypothetical protein
VLAEFGLHSGRHDQATCHATQAVQVQRATGCRLGEARALVALGDILYETNGAAATMPRWFTALEQRGHLGHRAAVHPTTRLDALVNV